MKISFIKFTLIIFIFYPFYSFGAECSDKNLNEIVQSLDSVNQQGSINLIKKIDKDKLILRKKATKEKKIIETHSFKCPENQDKYILYYILIDNDVLEYHSFINSDIFLNEFPFHSKNYINRNDVITPLEIYLDSNILSIEDLKLDLLDRGFFLHKEFKSGENNHAMVFIKAPFPIGSLIEQVGGNMSPNIPVSFCIQIPLNKNKPKEIKDVRDCNFEWNLYIQQLGDLANGILIDGRDQD